MGKTDSGSRIKLIVVKASVLGDLQLLHAVFLQPVLLVL